MTKASDSIGKEGAADFSADFGRLAAEMLENARSMPIHPLMAHPAAAMAAATAVGIGFSTQMAGAFFGALQGAFEATSRIAEALDETPPEAAKPEVRIKPENIRPAAAKKAALSIVAAPEPVAAKKPASRAKRADDLKLISGIGPKLEQVLNARGIRSFAAIAAWSDAEAAAIDAELGFDGRVARDDWRGQAKVFAAKRRKRV